MGVDISTKKIGIYKKVFTFREIEIFESISKDALEIYNYKLQSTGSAKLKKREQFNFFIFDYLVRYLHKLLNM